MNAGILETQGAGGWGAPGSWTAELGRAGAAVLVYTFHPFSLGRILGLGLRMPTYKMGIIRHSRMPGWLSRSTVCLQLRS